MRRRRRAAIARDRARRILRDREHGFERRFRKLLVKEFGKDVAHHEDHIGFHGYDAPHVHCLKRHSNFERVLRMADRPSSWFTAEKTRQ
jgi:hypothetical protein